MLEENQTKTVGTIWSVLRIGTSLLKGRKMAKVVLEGLSRFTILQAKHRHRAFCFMSQPKLIVHPCTYLFTFSYC